MTVSYTHLDVYKRQDLYGGNHDLISRQALHSHHLQFLNPFTDEMVHVELDMPEDMKNLLK